MKKIVKKAVCHKEDVQNAPKCIASRERRIGRRKLRSLANLCGQVEP